MEPLVPTTRYGVFKVTPLLGRSYETHVPQDTRLDILYLKDAVKAITQLYKVPNGRLKRRLYNVDSIATSNDRS
jgi:hypothetical protein